jgi:RNA polymerase sigma-70 factor, ECF subfamily
VDDLRVLYDLHGAEIFRFCFRLLGDRGQAEEAVQEAFLRAWRSRERWTADLGSIRTWLYAIARNVSIDLLRARSVRPQLSSNVSGFGTPNHSSGHSSNRADADVVDIRQQNGAPDAYDELLDGWMIEEGLRRLRDEQRHAIVETYVKGRPYADLAQELGIPEGTVRTRVFYGLKALRLALEEMGWNV